MKKQTEKKLNKKLKKRTSVEKNEERGLVRKNNNYGITLIALVITVIVLLILAGISISMLSGNNSILSRAGEAKIKTEYGKAQEALAMAYAEAVGDRYLNNSTTALENEVVQKLQNAGYTIGTQASGSVQIELSSTSVTLEEGGNTEEVTATIKADTKYMLVDGLYYPLTITNSTATLGKDGQSELTGSSISLDDLTIYTTGSITANLDTTTGVITITSGSVISDNNKVELVDSNGTNYGRINVSVISIIGDYVNYNVSYTDMYSDTDLTTAGQQAYRFTLTNGWRIIDQGTANSDGTRSNVKIISTGVPAILNYDDIANTGKINNGWWGTDDDVSSLYSTDSNLSTIIEKGYDKNNGGYPNYYAAAGLALYKNFKLIEFPIGTSATANRAYSKNLADTDGDGKITGNDFLISSIASEVHNLTLEELNKARGYTGANLTNTLISTETEDGDNGLFYLANLSIENLEFGYSTSITPYYWLASAANGTSHSVRCVLSNGNFGGGTGIDGIRPVILLKKNIRRVSEEHWEIVQ